MSRHKTRSLATRSVSLVIVLGLLFGLGYAAHHRLSAPLPAISPTVLYVPPRQSTASSSLTWPTGGQAAVGVVGYGVLATGGFQKPVPTASIAKLITILAVLKVKPLAAQQQGPILTLSQTDVNYYNTYVAENGSVADVQIGEQISEYQVIEAMLLPSANNFADTLATWAFGSLSAYATYANQMLLQMGLTQTHVGSDASGFLPNTTSTASDLVKLGEIAVANPIIAAIASQSTANIPVAGTIKNVNWLLGTDGINGLKTGNSDQAGGTFIFSAPYTVANGQTVTIIGALMDQPGLQSALNSAVPLLKSSQKAFAYGPAVPAGTAIGQYHVPWVSGRTAIVTAITNQAVQGLTWQGVPLSKPTVSLATITAPHDTVLSVGRVSITTGATTSVSPVKLTQPIPKPSIWWRLRH